MRTVPPSDAAIPPDGMEPAAEIGALFLDVLLGREGRWVRNPIGDKHIYTYVWWEEDGAQATTDTLVIIRRDFSFAKRVNNQDLLVWQAPPMQVSEIIVALQALPDPGTPGAPVQPLREAT